MRFPRARALRARPRPGSQAARPPIGRSNFALLDADGPRDTGDLLRATVERKASARSWLAALEPTGGPRRLGSALERAAAWDRPGAIVVVIEDSAAPLGREAALRARNMPVHVVAIGAYGEGEQALREIAASTGGRFVTVAGK